MLTEDIRWKIYDDDYENQKLLDQVLKLEKDIQLINEIIIGYNGLVQEQCISLNKIEETLTTTEEIIEESNVNLDESIDNKKSTVTTKTVVASLGLLCLNLPIGLAYGTNIMLTSLTISGLGAGYWIAK